MSTKTKKPDKYWLKEHAPIFLDGHESLPEPVTDAILLPHTSLDTFAQIENNVTLPAPIISTQTPNSNQTDNSTIWWGVLIVLIVLIICGALFLAVLASQVQIN